MQAMDSLKLRLKARTKILKSLEQAGLIDNDNDDGEEKFSSSDSLLMIASEFQERPEVFSSLLQSDFGVPPLVAHQTRAAAMTALSIQKDDEEKANKLSSEQRKAADLCLMGHRVFL